MTAESEDPGVPEVPDSEAVSVDDRVENFSPEESAVSPLVEEVVETIGEEDIVVHNTEKQIEEIPELIHESPEPNRRLDEEEVSLSLHRAQGSFDDSAILEMDERARTPEPTDSDISLLPDDDDEDSKERFTGRPTTEGFLQTYAFDRASLNSSCSNTYSRSHQARPYSIYQGKSAFESLINSSAERVLEKIKTRTIDLEPMDYFTRKMPIAPHTPPLVPSKARPRKLEPLRSMSTDIHAPDPFGGPPLTPVPQQSK